MTFQDVKYVLKRTPSDQGPFTNLVPAGRTPRTEACCGRISTCAIALIRCDRNPSFGVCASLDVEL